MTGWYYRWTHSAEATAVQLERSSLPLRKTEAVDKVNNTLIRHCTYFTPNTTLYTETRPCLLLRRCFIPQQQTMKIIMGKGIKEPLNASLERCGHTQPSTVKPCTQQILHFTIHFAPENTKYHLATCINNDNMTILHV